MHNGPVLLSTSTGIDLGITSISKGSFGTLGWMNFDNSQRWLPNCLTVSSAQLIEQQMPQGLTPSLVLYHHDVHSQLTLADDSGLTCTLQAADTDLNIVRSAGQERHQYRPHSSDLLGVRFDPVNHISSQCIPTSCCAVGFKDWIRNTTESWDSYIFQYD